MSDNSGRNLIAETILRLQSSNKPEDKEQAAYLVKLLLSSESAEGKSSSKESETSQFPHTNE
jgi:hypothetical protein